MGQNIPTDETLDPNERFERAERGDCPVCGVDFAESREVYERETDTGSEEMHGIEYDHGLSRCVEWADGDRGKPANE